MPHWILRIYSFYALLVFALLLIVALFFYIPVRIFVPYRQQIRWVYGINRGIMTIWAPLAGYRFRIVNEHLADRSKTYIVIVNHQNLLDMITAARHLRIPGKPLIKKELLQVPILGWLFAMAALAVDRGDRESRNRSFNAMVDEVGKGISILIFPEGTRNRTSDPLIDFRDGAFNLAVQTGVPVLPVLFMNIRDKCGPDSVIFRPARVIIRYLDPVDPAAFEGSPDALRDHCRQVMERAIIEYDPCFKTK